MARLPDGGTGTLPDPETIFLCFGLLLALLIVVLLAMLVFGGRRDG